MVGLKSSRASLREAGPYLALGTQFALLMIVGVGIGHLADSHWDVSPLFLIAGAFLGMGTGFQQLYRALMRANRPKGHGPSDSNGKPQHDRHE